MPYYKGVHFDQAFHTEEDVLQHNAANPAPAEEPVIVETPAEPVPEAPTPPPFPEVSVETQPGQEPGPEDVDLAVPVDRETPIVDTSHLVHAESDPFPSFEAEKEPETQPEEAEDGVEVELDDPGDDGKTVVTEGALPPGDTKPDSPDAKKAKKKSGRGK